MCKKLTDTKQNSGDNTGLNDQGIRGATVERAQQVHKLLALLRSKRRWCWSGRRKDAVWNTVP